MALTIEKDNSQYTIIKTSIDNGEGCPPVWTTDARTVYIVSDKALDFKLPNWDDTNDKPIITTTENIDVPASENLFEPTATTAGVIPSHAMPPFFSLANTSGATATVYIYILKHFT
tara:strand:+ start:494 stop:841 length:348 start_codon:yes stop_codon:yes gene_type:complete